MSLANLRYTQNSPGRHQAAECTPFIGPETFERPAAVTLVLGAALGIILTIWTWARAASMSADGAHYMELAERAWRIGVRFGMDWYAGPAYPVVTGWVYGVIGDLDFAGRLTSFLFGMATLLGVGLLALRLFGRAVACVSVGLLAVHTTFVRHMVMAETDAAYGCWLVWSILCVWELRRATSTGRQAFMASVAATTLGVGYLTRPEGAPLAGLLCLWYLFHRSPVTLTRRASEASEVSRSSLARRVSVWKENLMNGMGRRLAWCCLIAFIFLAIASVYLVRLRAELGRWSLSGKERSIVLKFVPDKRNYEEVLKMGVSGALLRNPSNILHWLPYHVHWGVPQFVKSLNPVVLVLAPFGVLRFRGAARAKRQVAFLLWVSVPFILFFFLTFPGRRYFMQAMPQWTILAALGTVELARLVAGRFALQKGSGVFFVHGKGPKYSADDQKRLPTPLCRRPVGIALAAPILLMAASTLWGNRSPIEQSLCTERAVGERILQIGGPGRRVLSFTVAAFYACGERVPLWGPMQGIVRCHGYGEPLSYEDFVNYVRRHRADFIVLDQDLRADCPEFLQRVRREDFELVADDIVDQHGPHLVFRTVSKMVSGE